MSSKLYDDRLCITFGSIPKKYQEGCPKSVWLYMKGKYIVENIVQDITYENLESDLACALIKAVDKIIYNWPESGLSWEDYDFYLLDWHYMYDN